MAVTLSTQPAPTGQRRRGFGDSSSAVSARYGHLRLGRRARHVVFGDRAEEIAAVAARCKAALVVTGSRRLGLAGRLFSTSTASALAGLAECAVAVVPAP